MLFFSLTNGILYMLVSVLSAPKSFCKSELHLLKYRIAVNFGTHSIGSKWCIYSSSSRILCRLYLDIWMQK